MQFEVVSLKRAEPPGRGDRIGCSGGPGTLTPDTWTCPHIPLSELIFSAYDLEIYEFRPPEWMQTTWVAIAAKMPPGTTREQFRTMQRHLLEERFQLALHREPKEATVYELVVAKNGPKMHESKPDAAAPAVDWGWVPGTKLGPDRYPVLPEGVSALVGINGRRRWRSSNVTLADLARVIRRDTGSDVADRTGLKGKYDIDLYWQQRPIEYSPELPPYEGPELGRVIQDRLGLRLESKKGAVGIVVIDHIEKVPVEN
jgi:uncharacterized protein (TIGR03435 family)